MNAIKVLIADSNDLIREGLKAMTDKTEDICVVAETTVEMELPANINNALPDVVILDYFQPSFSVETIRLALQIKPSVKILALTEKCERTELLVALKAGIHGHILYCCDKKEITDAIRSVAAGDKFYCGKVLEILNGRPSAGSCSPVTISEREIEIIGLIAEGLSNKQIAERLFLSAHTVNTHRKNIMNKLGVNNTAGIVMYAVRENIINPNKYLFAQG